MKCKDRGTCALCCALSCAALLCITSLPSRIKSTSMPSRKKTDGSARSFHVGVPPNKLLIWRAENVVVQLQDGVPLMHTNVGQNTAASSRKEFMVLSGQGAKYIALDNRGASGPTCSSTVMHSYTILLPHKGYMAHNLYESLSAVWFPVYLFTYLNSGTNYTGVFLSTPRKMPSDFFGRAFLTKAPEAVKFEREGECHVFSELVSLQFPFKNLERNYSVATLQTALSSKPSIGHFADSFMKYWGIVVTKPKQLNKLKVVFARRKTGHRRIVNEEQVRAALSMIPNTEFHFVDFAQYPIIEQAKMLANQTAVFIFMHGGAGALTLFLPPGSAVVELFPYMWTNPMYKNFVISTGKHYLQYECASHEFHNSSLWQRANHGKRINWHNSNMEVDVPNQVRLAKAAMLSVLNDAKQQLVASSS